MLTLLETGRALYVLVGICILGLLARLQTRNLYKRLIRESTNLAAAKNKGLRELRERAETAWHMNQGMHDTGSWLERQLGELRFRGLSLSGWVGFSTQLTWLCLIAGGAGAFFSYWYRLDTYYIVMYGGGAVLMAMVMMLFDGNVAGSRREQLIASLQDYLENTMFPRMGRLSERADHGEKERSEHDKSGGRFGFFERRRLAEEESATGAEDRKYVREEEQPENRRASLRRASREQEPVQAVAAESGVKRQASREKRRESAEMVKSLTAASVSPEDLPEPGEERNWLKELNPEEARVIGDILRHYLT